jgi:hypothetical protein
MQDLRCLRAYAPKTRRVVWVDEKMPFIVHVDVSLYVSKPVFEYRHGKYSYTTFAEWMQVKKIDLDVLLY